MTPRDRRWSALASSLLLFAVGASQALLETARDAVFLSRSSASKLPWAYLLTAAAVSLAALLMPRATGDPRRRTALVLVSTAIAMLALYVRGSHAPLAPYAIFAAVGVAATLMLVQTWTLIGAQFHVADARRLFALISAGGALGAIAGAALAARIVADRGPGSLIAVAGAILALASGVPFLLRRPTATPRPLPSAAHERQAPLRRMTRLSYARRLFAMVSLLTIATTAADYLFKASVGASIAKSELGSFFAHYQLAMSAAGLVIQIGVAPLLLRRVGANRSVLLLPLAMAGAATGFMLVPGLVAATAMKSLDGALRGSVHRPGNELLYLPLPVSVRARLKTLADGVGQRGAQAIASLLILGALALRASPLHVAVGVALAAAGSAWVAIGLGRRYVQLYRDQLRQGTLDASVGAAQLDLESVESLLAMLSSPNDARVLSAVETLASQGKAKLIPSLLLYHPSPTVASRVLEILAQSGRRDFVPLTERLVASDSALLAGAAARIRADLVGDERELRRFADDLRDEVRTAGLAGLVRNGVATPGDWSQLRRIERDGTTDERLQLLAAILRLSHPRLTSLAAELATVDDADVQLAAVRALQSCGDPRGVPVALRLLGRRDTRDRARRIFLDAGPRGLELLASALDDVSLDAEVRRHIPRTVSRFASERAATILLRGLSRADLDGVTRYKMLRGLGRMKRNHPELPLDKRAVRVLARQAIARAHQLRRWAASLGDVASARAGALLKTLVARKERMAFERLFRALDLLRPGAELERVHHGLTHPDPGRRALSRELLEYLVDPALRDDVLALVDADGEAAQPLGDAMEEMRRDHSSAVRTLAEEYVAGSIDMEVRRAA